MNFAELPPSKQWAALKYRGEKFADVWFKPEGQPLALTFRIPGSSFRIPGMAQQLTLENLLRAVALAPTEVASWRQEDVNPDDSSESCMDVGSPLGAPPADASHVEIHVRLKPPAEAKAEAEPSMSGVVPEGSVPKWEDLEARWKAILALESAMDTLRMSMESLLAEMEGALKKTLSMEEKVHALRADVANWTKAKGRLHHAVPKVREVIHRCVWALGAPERKQLDEVYKSHIQTHMPFPRMDKLLPQLENLQKDRQILSAHATTVLQESKAIVGDVHNALRMLQGNAAANKKKGAAGGKGKFFKQVRRWSGAE